MSSKIISNLPYTIKNYLQKLANNGYLIRVLATRELKIKYSRTFFGIGWVILQPLVVVTVYTVFFKNFIKLDTQQIPYPQFVLTGLVLWYLFTGIISKCSHAILESSDLISKISFPRIIIVFVKCIPIILECFVLLIICFIVLFATKTGMGINSITSIFYFIQTTILAFSIGLFCSILALKYRDLVHAIPFVINFGIWLTPVFYSSNIVPAEYKDIFVYCNPLALSLEGMRGAIFHNSGISLPMLILFIITISLFIVSFYTFVKFEKRIVENL